MRLKSLAAGLAAAVALTLPFAVAAPASAATLPDGDSLWAITCEYDEQAEGDRALLYSVDPADAVGVAVGTGTFVGGDCGGQAAYNPVTGASYYLTWTQDAGLLAKIDVSTGISTLTPFTGSGPLDPNSIAIGTDGTGYMLETSLLSKFNVETGAAELLGDIGIGGFYAFSVDPASGRLYGLLADGAAYLIDPVGLTATFQGNVVGEPDGFGFYSLQIDTAGTWWVKQDGPAGSYVVTGSRPNPDAATQFATVGILSDAGDPEVRYAESFLITYPKALAATGMDATVLIGAGATAALLLLMGGAVLVLRRRAA